MYRFLIVISALLIASCDPGVYENLHVTPGPAQSAAPLLAQQPDPLAAIDGVARRFGLQPKPAPSDGVGRYWSGPIEANGHSVLHVHAARAADGRFAITVGEMYTGHWSVRGDSLRRAIIATLRSVGTITP